MHVEPLTFELLKNLESKLNVANKIEQLTGNTKGSEFKPEAEYNIARNLTKGRVISECEQAFLKKHADFFAVSPHWNCMGAEAGHLMRTFEW